MPGLRLPFRIAWSYKIGRIFGIDIRVHTIFVAMILLFSLRAAWLEKSWTWGGINLFVLVLLFLFVLLHELGHSLAAKALGIRVIDITLWPLGGMARLAEIPEEPSVELRVALAGPAVNFAIIVLTLVPVLLLGSPERIEEVQRGITYFLRSRGEVPLDFVVIILVVNAALGTINLLPAFPLDGGRVLRALMARKMPYLRATERAVRIGKYAAVLGLLLSLFNGKFIPALICLFVIWAGSAELHAARAREFMRAARRGFGPFTHGSGEGERGFSSGTSADPRGDGTIEADVISTSWPEEEEARRRAEREARRKNASAEEDLDDHLDESARDFLKMVDRYKPKDS